MAGDLLRSIDLGEAMIDRFTMIEGQGSDGSRRIVFAAAIAALLAVSGAVATGYGYWPGLMTWDSVNQYGQALAGSYDDWHPPLMAWSWRQLLAVHAGPAPMLVVQLLLYWSGFGLLGGWALQQRRPAMAIALVAGGCMPLALALMGAVLKDCLMTGVLVFVVGLLAVVQRRPAGHLVLRALGIVMLLLVACLRFNAFLACAPLFFALLPETIRRGPLRATLAAIVATVLLLAAVPVAYRALDARRSGVELSLIIFDLGGITDNAGVDVFPPLGVRDAVAVNHRCYSPVKWDTYSDWVDPECPLGYTAMREAITADHLDPYRLWVAAIVAHPAAYAWHRLRHFNINTRFLIHDDVERPVQVQDAPNRWGFAVTPNVAVVTIDDIARWSAATPLGWPIAWLAVAVGVLIASPSLRHRGLIVPVALSSLFYGAGFAAFSVASELRYHLWPMIAAAVAMVVAATDGIAPNALSPCRRWFALAPACVVTGLAAAWRLW